MNHKKTRKMIYLALLSAIAIVLHTVEAAIPVPLPVGAKLGLANIISLVVIHLYGIKEMFIVNIFRVLVSSLLTGIFMQNPFFISCGGVFLSSLALAIIYKFVKLPMVSTSIVSAIFHNIGQVAVVAFIFSFAGIMVYVLPLLITSIPTGILTGLVAIEILKRVKKEQFQ